MKGIFVCYRLLLIAPGCFLQAASRKLRACEPVGGAKHLGALAASREPQAARLQAMGGDGETLLRAPWGVRVTSSWGVRVPHRKPNLQTCALQRKFASLVGGGVLG